MSLLLAAFVKELSGLLDRLVLQFPFDDDVVFAQKKVMASLDLSPNLVAATILDNVNPYLHRLKMQDEAFFLTLAKNELALDLNDKWGKIDAAERLILFKTVEKLITIAQAIRNRRI